MRGRKVLRLRLHVCAFEVLDRGQRHGGCAGRRAAIVRRGQLLTVRRGVVLLVLVVLMLVVLLLVMLLLLLGWRERRRALHLRRGLLLLLLLLDGRRRGRAMRALSLVVCVLVHSGGDRDHSRGVTCTAAAADGWTR